MSVQEDAEKTGVSPGKRGRVDKLLLLILCAACVLRAVYLIEAAGKPAFGFPEVDAGYSDAWGRALATGNWTEAKWHEVSNIPTMPFFRPPGYSYFLGLVYRLGRSHLLPRIVQLCLGVLNAFLAYLLARKWFGRMAGLIAAAGLGCHWLFLYFECELLEPALLIGLGLGMLYALSTLVEKPTFPRATCAGILAGLFALTRPNILLFLPAAAAWVAWLGARRKEWRPAVVAIGGLGLGACLCILPVTVRNYRVSGDLVLISSNAGINLYIGNNEHADGLFVGRIMEHGSFRTSDLYSEIVAALEREQGRSLKYSEVSSYFAQQALKFIREHPGKFAALLGRKVVLFWSNWETGHNRSIHYDRRFSPLLSRLPTNFAALFALTVVGLALLFAVLRDTSAKLGEGTAGRSKLLETAVLLLLFVCVYFASFLPFFVTTQYRAPVIPVMIVLAAGGSVSFGRADIGKRRLALGVATCLGLGAYCFSAVNWTGYAPNLAKWHFDNGVAHEKCGHAAEARESYDKAITANPRMSAPRINLGIMAGKAGDHGRAVELLSSALELGTRSPEYVLNNLGNNLAKLGCFDQAIASYEQALRIKPDFADVHNNLGNVLLATRQYDRAVGHFETALKMRPNSAFAHVNWGNACLAMGRPGEAKEHFREALRIRPDLVRVRHMLWRLEAEGPRKQVPESK